MTCVAHSGQTHFNPLIVGARHDDDDIDETISMSINYTRTTVALHKLRKRRHFGTSVSAQSHGSHFHMSRKTCARAFWYGERPHARSSFTLSNLIFQCQRNGLNGLVMCAPGPPGRPSHVLCEFVIDIASGMRSER